MAHISNISNIANIANTQLLLINPKINQSLGLSEKISWFSPEKTCNKCKIFWPRSGDKKNSSPSSMHWAVIGNVYSELLAKTVNFSPFVNNFSQFFPIWKNAEVCGLALPCSAFGALLQGVGCGLRGLFRRVNFEGPGFTVNDLRDFNWFQFTFNWFSF